MGDRVLKTVEELVRENIIFKPLDGNHGSIHPKHSDFIEAGIPFVTAADVKNGKVDLIGCKFISLLHAKRLQKGFSIEGDVLLTHKASLGRVAVVPKLDTPFIMLTPQVTYYRVKDKSKLSSSFLKYYFLSPFFQETLLIHGSSGSTRDYVGIGAQNKLPVLLPPLEEQEAIVEVLCSLDDKIDLLHRQNLTLEEMADTLFRQWFVEEAQEAIENVRVIDLAIHKKVPVVPGKTPNKRFAHYSLPAFDGAKRPEYQFGSEILSSKYLVYPGVILVSKLNPRTPRIWFVHDCDIDSICSTEFQVYEPIDAKYSEFVYCFLRSKESIDALTASSSGTSGSHQRVNVEDINKLSIKSPDEGKLNAFHSIVSDWLKKVSLNQMDISRLEQTRDTLLPRLMDGSVIVN